MAVAEVSAFPWRKSSVRDYVTMRRYVAVSLQLAAVMSVVIAVVTSIYCADILHMMRYAGEHIHGEPIITCLSRLSGVPFTFFYNLLSSIIRALGDSSDAVWFLLLSTVLNVLLDLFCILVLGWGSGRSCHRYALKPFTRRLGHIVLHLYDASFRHSEDNASREIRRCWHAY